MNQLKEKLKITFCKAAENGALIEGGADVNIDDGYESLLELVITLSHIEIVGLLKNSGAKLT